VGTGEAVVDRTESTDKGVKRRWAKNSTGIVHDILCHEQFQLNLPIKRVIHDTEQFSAM